jgi:hypothetical protein
MQLFARQTETVANERRRLASMGQKGVTALSDRHGGRNDATGAARRFTPDMIGEQSYRTSCPS